MIRMHFTNADDSPTNATPVRIRYSLQPDGNGNTVPVLRFGHGTDTLTREAWQGYQAAGGILEASSEREASILRQVLGVDARIVQASA